MMASLQWSLTDDGMTTLLLGTDRGSVWWDGHLGGKQLIHIGIKKVADSIVTGGGKGVLRLTASRG